MGGIKWMLMMLCHFHLCVQLANVSNFLFPFVSDWVVCCGVCAHMAFTKKKDIRRILTY